MLKLLVLAPGREVGGESPTGPRHQGWPKLLRQHKSSDAAALCPAGFSHDKGAVCTPYLSILNRICKLSIWSFSLSQHPILQTTHLLRSPLASLYAACCLYMSTRIDIQSPRYPNNGPVAGSTAFSDSLFVRELFTPGLGRSRR